MLRTIVVGVIAAASAVAGFATGGSAITPVTVRAAESGICPPAAPSARPARLLATGRGLASVAGDRLVSASRTGLASLARAPGEAMIRHVAAAPGIGTAYVVDRAGGDEVVVATPAGVRRVSEPGEATHPAWSPAGDLAWATGQGIAVLDRSDGRIERFDGPIGGATVFSPVILTQTKEPSAVASPPTHDAPEGAQLDELWVTSTDRATWRRLTDFRATGDDWVAIRTPIVFRGSVFFVRVVGRASATGSPRFELWRLDHGSVSRVRRLAGERFLAGSSRGRLLWNVPVPGTVRQALVVSGPEGPRTIGCGAVRTDPTDRVDPDRLAGTGVHVPARGVWEDLEQADESHGEAIAIIVGDYATAGEAQAVVDAIAAEYPEGGAEVVDSTTAPLAIRPGVHGALLHLPQGVDPTVALAEFRDRLPEYTDVSWVVTP
jgi:hypothetical protein